MAYPWIQSSAVTHGITATGVPSVGLPSGIVAGDLLVVLFRTANGIAGITWPAGWTELIESTTDSSDDATAIGYRRATGPEIGPIMLATASARYAAIALRIYGAEDPAIQPPELSPTAIGFSDQPNPNACTPTGGVKDYLWLWAGGWEGIHTSPPAGVPVGYSSPLGGSSGSSLTPPPSQRSNCRVALASRHLRAASENPGPWQTSAVDDWTAWCVAIHPAALFDPDPDTAETIFASPREVAVATDRTRIGGSSRESVAASERPVIASSSRRLT